MSVFQINDKLDFSKGSWARLGTCVVVECNFGRTKVNWKFKCLAGANEGKMFTASTRSVDGLNSYATKVGTAAKEAQAVREAEYEKAEAKYTAAREVSQWIEAGDLVNVKTSKSNYNIKVLEVDFKQGRIKGVNAEAYNPSSRMSWVSLTHEEVMITLVKKNAFDPKTDEQVLRQAENAAAVGAKRAATRSRRADLRNRYGY